MHRRHSRQDASAFLPLVVVYTNERSVFSRFIKVTCVSCLHAYAILSLEAAESSSPYQHKSRSKESFGNISCLLPACPQPLNFLEIKVSIIFRIEETGELLSSMHIISTFHKIEFSFSSTTQEEAVAKELLAYLKTISHDCDG
jgi:hypothetical protein